MSLGKDIQYIETFFFSRYDRRHIYEEARSGHVTVNVWGWFSIHGMGDVKRIEGRFTAAKYLDILQDFFLPSLQVQNHPFPDGPILFVHDHSPIHTARVVNQWFDGREDLQLLNWPSKGCDMNPIENIWANISPVNLRFDVGKIAIVIILCLYDLYICINNILKVYQNLNIGTPFPRGGTISPIGNVKA